MFLRHVDPADENDAKPLPPTVCWGCLGSGRLYRNSRYGAGGASACPTCQGTGTLPREGK